MALRLVSAITEQAVNGKRSRLRPGEGGVRATFGTGLAIAGAGPFRREVDVGSHSPDGRTRKMAALNESHDLHEDLLRAAKWFPD
jgi:hypothetical protein